MVGFIWGLVQLLVGLILLAILGFIFVAVCWVVIDTVIEHRKSKKEKDQ